MEMKKEMVERIWREIRKGDKIFIDNARGYMYEGYVMWMKDDLMMLEDYGIQEVVVKMVDVVEFAVIKKRKG